MSKEYTIEQYVNMSEKFNKMTFIDKIGTIKENTDILILGADGNWWGVKVKDIDIQTTLEENGLEFEINKEWDSSEMQDLINILGIEITDI
jgi:hypothetical protein